MESSTAVQVFLSHLQNRLSLSLKNTILILSLNMEHFQIGHMILLVCMVMQQNSVNQ